jgi:hypothetical protein
MNDLTDITDQLCDVIERSLKADLGDVHGIEMVARNAAARVSTEFAMRKESTASYTEGNDVLTGWFERFVSKWVRIPPPERLTGDGDEPRASRCAPPDIPPR